MIRGPGYYHPNRHPDRLLARRNLVLELMAKQGVISKVQYLSAKQSALGVIQVRATGASSYPAFMALVRRQLKEDYREKDLTSEGLRIFTTLDPWVQYSVEETVKQQVKSLDRQRGLNGQLQAAAIITNTTNGEVLAMLGDRKPGYAGFNRVLDAQRPVGSLMKPAIFLTAIEKTNQYNLLTQIDDSAITLQAQGGTTWSPKNYDGKSHGKVPLYTALAKSYNQATVRLGLHLGFEAIENTLQRLGIKKSIPPYPSMLLGAIELSPMEIAQMYQTIAAGGFRTPLRAIREVMTADGLPLQRYPIHVEQTIDSASIAVLTSAMQEIMRNGTGKRVKQYFPNNIELAGKTGTTDELRDSWFAGFGRDYLALSGWVLTIINRSAFLAAVEPWSCGVI